MSFNIEEFKTLIHEGKAKDPLIFLEAIMGGQDLRNLSGIYELVMDIDSFSNGAIEISEWNEVLDLVSSRYKYQTIPLSESIAAAKTISEYIHPKRKQIETSTIDNTTSPNNDPLTENEIKLFREKFNDEF